MAKGATSVSTLDGKTIIRGGSSLKMYNHKNSSVEEDMENDADNELDENETGSDFLSGTFTRYSENMYADKKSLLFLFLDKISLL